MSETKRKNFSGEFKAKVGLEAIHGVKTINQIAQEHGVHPVQVWAVETMGNPRYPLKLFMRVVTVSLETMKIVNGLPKLEVLEK